MYYGYSLPLNKAVQMCTHIIWFKQKCKKKVNWTENCHFYSREKSAVYLRSKEVFL